MLGVFVRTVYASLRRRARRQWGVARGQCGAVTFVQRFGDALNLNVHFHTLALDGVYTYAPDAAENPRCTSSKYFGPKTASAKRQFLISS